jgi:hypothetical protein
MWGRAHIHCMPSKKSSPKKALKKAQKFYKDALVAGAKKHTRLLNPIIWKDS